MRGRRGEGLLTDNALSMIIAAFCIAVLIIVGVKIYQMHKNIEKENALDVLNSLVGKIELIKDGEKSDIYLQGFKNAEMWEIVGWDKYEKGRPAVCWFSACVCVYKTQKCIKNQNDKLTVLGEFKGDKVCRRIDSLDKVQIKSEMKIEKYSEGAEGIKYYSDVVFIKMPKNILTLNVLKNKGAVSISGSDRTDVICII